MLSLMLCLSDSIFSSSVAELLLFLDERGLSSTIFFDLTFDTSAFASFSFSFSYFFASFAFKAFSSSFL
jgi:hypothetical protein